MKSSQKKTGLFGNNRLDYWYLTIDNLLITTKLTLMYREYKQEALNGKIWIIPYNNLNEKNKRVVVDALNDNLDDNSFVIYEIDENTPIYLGYFKLDNTHIRLSNLFNTLRHNSILGGTGDPLLALENEKCLHISKWVFDKQLCQAKMLDKIFTYITTFVQRPFILWCEIDNNLLFHKVNNEPYGQTAAVAYFITYFPKK